MTDEPKPARKSKRPYVRVCDRRRCGGQLGNTNALKTGLHTIFERVKRREVWRLLQEIRWALRAVQPFVQNAKDHPKKSKTNVADSLSRPSGYENRPPVKSQTAPKKLRKTPEPRDACAQERHTRDDEP